MKSRLKLAAVLIGAGLSVPVSLPLLFGGSEKLIVYACETGWACLILLSAWLLGRKLLSFLYCTSQPFSALEAFLVSTGVGLTVTISLFALLGWLKLYYAPVIALAALLPMAAGLPDLRMVRSFRLGDFPDSCGEEEQAAIMKWPWVLFALLAGFNLLCALSPIFFYDALSYHLSVPAEWLKAHRIFTLPWNSHSFVPGGFSMLMMPCLVSESGVTAKVLSNFLGILSALTVYAIGKRLMNPLAGILAAILFYSVPLIVLISNFVQADFASAFFGLLALFLLLRSMQGEGPRARSFILAGLFLGVLASLKYSTWIYGATLFFLAGTLALPRAVEKGKRLRPAVIFLILAAAPLLPWLIRDFVTTGNPVFPMAYGLFDGKYWSRIQADDFASSLGRSQGGSTGPNAWLHVSKELFFHLGELGAFSGVILLVVPLTVLVAARRKFNRHHGFLLAAFLVPLIAWVPITAGNPANLLRYNLSSLAAGGILFACGMECILRRKTIQAAVVVSIFLFNTGYGILRAQELTRTLEVTAGTLSRDAFLKSHLAFYPAVRFINRNLPMTARVLFVGETRGFYCAVPAVIPGSFNGPWFMDLGRNGFQNGFRELGITHILIHVDELNRLKEQGLNWRFEPETATAFLQALYSLKIVYRDSSVVVVEFAKPGPAARGRAVR